MEQMLAFIIVSCCLIGGFFNFISAIIDGVKAISKRIKGE